MYSFWRFVFPPNFGSIHLRLKRSIMKKLLITHEVKDLEWWLHHNSLDAVWSEYGIKCEIFTQKNSARVALLVTVPSAQFIDDVLRNSTLVTTSMKADGVVIETLQIFEHYSAP